jgi:micrococcal nuclease
MVRNTKMTARICLMAILLLILLALGCGGGGNASTVKVSEVIDGDTIVISGGHHVRYIGIDAPELHPKLEPYGVEAWQANRALVEGKKVRMERDVSNTDKYGRLLRYIYVDDTFVNAELVKQGYACARAYPPDTKYQGYLKEMENEAKKAGRGMWAK